MIMRLIPQPPQSMEKVATSYRIVQFAWSLVAASPLLASPLFAASYHLTFDDEFNNYNSSRWQTADFNGMRNNGGDFQGQWFCDPTYAPSGYSAYNPFSSTSGVLTIQAKPTPTPNTYAGAPTPNAQPQPFVSGQLTTAHKFTQRYGYYEVRAKMSPGKGLWHRFWLLTDDGGWPGEYDIFEVIGKEKPVKVHQTTHYRDASHLHGMDGFTYDGIVPTDGKFHTYGFLWEPKTVTWYVDGVATLKQVNRINIPMYVLLDVAVGKDPGNTWPGNPDATTPWPASMEMDYFRIYSSDPSLPNATLDAGYKPSVLPEGHTVETTPSTPKLPAGWTSCDIGSPDVKGSSTWNPITGEWMVKGTGYGIGGWGDQCHFAGAALSADGCVTATVQDVAAINTDDVKSGVMIRESTGQSVREISLLYSAFANNQPPTTSLVFQSRSDANRTTLRLATVANIKAPVTVRLIRRGNTFTGDYSANGGLTWATVGTPQTISMAGTVQAGLAVGGNQSNYHRLARANFINVSVGQVAPTLTPASSSGISPSQPNLNLKSP